MMKIMKEQYKRYINNVVNFDRLTMLGIICLLIVITGVFGFIYEFIFYYLNSGCSQFYWRGGNFLPWINIYAIGGLIIYFLTFKYRKSPIKVFLISFFVCGILEFVSGFVMYTFFDGFRCWDYNTEILNFGNIGGFVCLRSILFFGISSLLLIYCVVPLCFYLARKMDKKIFVTISISLCIIFLFDEIYNLIIARLFSMDRASDIYKKIGFHFVSFK